MATRQRRFEIRVFLPLGGRPSTADELHLPAATGFEAPVTRLAPLLLNENIWLNGKNENICLSEAERCIFIVACITNSQVRARGQIYKTNKFINETNF